MTSRSICKRSVLALLFATMIFVQQQPAVAEPIPSIACTINGLPVNCDVNPTNVFVHIGVSGLGTSSLDVQNGSFAGILLGQLDVQSASASASLDFWVMGEGPVRPGFVSFVVGTDTDGSGVATGSAFASITGLGSCGSFPIPCLVHDDFLPFTLGVPVRLQLQTAASASFPDTARSFSAGVRLQLFDESFTPVNIVQATVPEPAAWQLLFLGLIPLRFLRRVI